MSVDRVFGPWDYVVFGIVLIVSAGIGLFYAFTGGKQRTTKEFLMADRNMRLLPIAISILVSFISAIMILGTAAEMHTAGTEYWMLAWGMSMSNIMAALIFVPLLHPLKLTSSYEYLERRFQHRAVKLVGSVIMLIQQILYMGIASYAPSTALEAVTKFPDWATIIIVCMVATFYTTLGGMKAVVWTDVFQAVIMVAGLFAVIIQGAISVGGLGEVWRLNEEWDRINFPTFHPDPTIRHSFWNLFVGGTVSSMSNFAISQASVQRYSTLSSVRKAQVSLLLNCIGVVLMMTLTCLSGVVIFSYYAQKGCDPLASGEIKNSNQIAPYFVMEVLGYPGLPGLFVACLFSGALSSMSSSLNAAATVTWTDFLKPRFGHLSMKKQTLITKGLVVGFGVIGIAMSFMARSLGGTVIQAASAFTGSASGPLLGLFLLGGVFPWANWKGAVVGGIVGLAFPMWINIGSYTLDPESHNLPSPIENCDPIVTTQPPSDVGDITGISKLYTVSYRWFASVGVATCVIVGLAVSFATGPTKPDQVDRKYLIPIFDRLFCCLPERVLGKCRCGTTSQEDEDEELDDLETSTDLKQQSIKGNKVAPAESNETNTDFKPRSLNENKEAPMKSDEEMKEPNGIEKGEFNEKKGDNSETIQHGI
ncbi:LOW QUALITY PROTEIN: sodium-coupled monocarboxylate transporter 1-like [Liolophura sinensis]|uniref:LOW QUALITY PROTEIN: sodium-coupled monocarboxylate transporter 1-like n=1 Tax=Liolophura sinensis TaxID=3198878 RepID=UPI0031597E2F